MNNQIRTLSVILLPLFLILFSCGKNSSKETFIPSLPLNFVDTLRYKKGEKLLYTAHLGMLKAAQIELNVDTGLHLVNQKPCFKIKLTGELDGSVDVFSNLNDEFESFVDTSTLKPVLFIRNLKENKYKLLEYNHFDFAKMQVKLVQKNTSRQDSIRYYPITSNINDLLSVFFQLRKIDFNSYKSSDTLSLDVFIEEQSFNLKFNIVKKESIKTRIGKKNAFVIVPIVPENQLFRGENPVTIWISDDELRVPLLIKTKSWVGNVQVELKEYSQKR